MQRWDELTPIEQAKKKDPASRLASGAMNKKNKNKEDKNTDPKGLRTS